jgi:hypothetical protein
MPGAKKKKRIPMTKRRLIRWLLILAVFGAFALWLEPTRVVWGWLRGEAFYQGRPTSYWRDKCDEWIERFDDPDFLTLTTWLLPFEVPADPGLRKFGIPEDLPNVGGGFRHPRETLWRRFVAHFRSEDDLKRERGYDFAPRILWATPDTEPVLLELQQEEKYRGLATLALRRVAEYRKWETIINQELEAAR